MRDCTRRVDLHENQLVGGFLATGGIEVLKASHKLVGEGHQMVTNTGLGIDV